MSTVRNELKERNQTIAGLVQELENTFNFAALGLNPENIAKYVSQFPDKSPLELVYKNGKNLEFDETIHEDLSSLIGFKITYQDDDGEKTSVILFNTITKDDFGPNETITIGKLRESAKKHGNGKIINEAIARAIWQHAESFYAMQFMLSKRGVSFQVFSLFVLARNTKVIPQHGLTGVGFQTNEITPSARKLELHLISQFGVTWK